MGFLDRAKGFVKSAARVVVSVVSDAMSWLANEGENFIGTVKETYAKIKPFLVKTSPFIKYLENIAPFP